MIRRSVAGLLSLLVLVGCVDRPLLAPEAALSRAGAADDPVRVIVRMQSRAAQAEVAQHALSQGGRVTREFKRFPLIALEVNRNALEGLSRMPRVVSIMEDMESHPLLNASLGAINAAQVHALGWDGSGVAVAILDTGIDAVHPFLSPRVVAEACFSTASENRVSLCRNGQNTDTGPGSASIDVTACQHGTTNLCDHGQHVAGIAAGDGSGVSGAPAAGVAPGASLIGIQVFRRATTGCPGSPPCLLAATSDLIAALEHVLDLSATHNIAAVNMSLGGGSHGGHCDGDPRKVAIDALLAAGIASVISSGNDGWNDRVSEPACSSTAVAVGATTNLDNIPGFSNRGPLLDLFAPGRDITSSVNNGGYGVKSGTSMAAPHVAGAWAVLRQVAPTLTVQEALDILQSTGTPVTYLSGGTQVTTPRINLLAALGAATPPPILTVTSASVAVDEGSTAVNSGTFSDPNGGSVTLSASVGTVVDNGNGAWTWSLATTDGPAEGQTVTITGTNAMTAQGSVAFSLQVLNVAPLVSAGPDASITTNEAFAFAGSFSDPGISDQLWQWVIDWGDGTQLTGGTHVQALPILASRQFCAAQTYTVTLRVTDKDNGTGADQLTLTVAPMAITIDIMPGGHPNSISLSKGGLLPVAALSSAGFDATLIDPATITLGDEFGSDTPVALRPDGRRYAVIEDVNRDGRPDLLLHFQVPALVANGDLTPSTTSLALRGFLADGCTNVRGADSVRVVP
jgi:subtilisin family serine protease